MVWPVSSLSVGAKGRILPFHHLQGFGQFFSFGRAFRLDGHGDDRFREGDRFQHDRVAGVAQRVAGDGVPQTDDADDIAGRGRGNLLAAVGLDVPKLRHVFLFVLAGVQHPGAGLQRAGIDPHVVQIAMLVGIDFEDQAAKRRVGVGRATLRRVLVFGIDAFDRRHVGRAGQIIGHRVEQRLDADEIERRPAQHRHDQAVQRRLAQHAADQLDRHVGLFQHQLGQLVRVFEQLGEHFLAPQRGHVGHLGRNRPADDVGALARAGKRQILHRHQIDDAAKRLGQMRRSLAERNLHGDRIGRKPLANFVKRALEIGPFAVELVDEGQPRHAVLVGLAPDRFALCLDPLASAEDDHAAVEHAETAFDLGREVDVAGSVDQIDDAIVPAKRDAGGSNGDAALLLLGIEIGDRGPFIDVAHLVAGTGIEQHPLGDRGLAGVDVGNDADVAELGEIASMP